MTDAVAMVFVSTNEQEVLIPALQSLFDSDNVRASEILVVDNDSKDDTAAEIQKRWPAVRVITQEERLGLPANLNAGIRATSAPYVMLCNPDLIFRDGSVDRLATFLDTNPRAGIAAPKLISEEGEPRTSARRWYTFAVLLALKGPWRSRAGRLSFVKRNLYEDLDLTIPQPVDWVPCPATMMRRAALDQVGLMDERFWVYFDDVDISLRMHLSDWEVWLVPDSEVVHLEQRSSIRPLSTAWRWHLESLIKFYWKHRRLRP